MWYADKARTNVNAFEHGLALCVALLFGAPRTSAPEFSFVQLAVGRVLSSPSPECIYPRIQSRFLLLMIEFLHEPKTAILHIIFITLLVVFEVMYDF